MIETTPYSDFASRAIRPRRRVRVLFINDTARNGGPGRSLHYILKFLDPHVVERHVLLPREGLIADLLRPVAEEVFFEPRLVENPIEPWERAMSRADYEAPLPLRVLRLSGNIVRATAGILHLARLARKAQYDLLYCNGTSANFAGGALAKLSGIPALWHVRYTSVPPAVRRLHDRLAKSSGVQRIVCVSQAAASPFSHSLDKTRVIHNAVDVEEFRPGRAGTLRRELGFGEDVVVFGSQGRILPRKGYMEMIRAADIALSRLGPGRERIRFVVLGDTPEDLYPDHLAECRAFVASRGLDKYVHFLGFRSNVVPYVADFDVAVVPSVYPDPLPRAVIEAMSLGKPVIAFDVGGVSEMLHSGQGGVLVRGTPPDVEGLADQFVEYARDDQRRVREGILARTHIERSFNARTQAIRIQNEIVFAAGLDA